MIKFGPAGNDDLFFEQGLSTTEQAIKWVTEYGLNAYEYSCGRGITMGLEKAKLISNIVKDCSMTISVHAPYYINFANPDDEMVEKSYNYVLRSLELVNALGGNRVVVHPASCGKLDRNTAIELTKKRLQILALKVKEHGFNNSYVCLETMGKKSQIGSYEEVIDFCLIDEIFLPTFDFGHINSFYNGILKSEEDYDKIISLCINKLGLERTKKIHIHFSKIEYSDKGEVRHLTFEDTKYGPEFEPLAKIIKKYGLTPVIICESHGTMAQDALFMKKNYEKLFDI